MNETRIALAFVVLGAALLVGAFAYLAYDDRDDGAGIAGAHPARGSTQAKAPQGQERRSGAGGPEAAGAIPRPVATGTAPARPPAPAPVRADAHAPPPAAVPAYAPLRESRADGVTEVVVGTEATGEDEMRLVASDLASYHPGVGVLLVEFRGGASGDASAGRENGFALVFGSREAALAPDLHYTEEEVDELFEEDGGVRAVSYDEFGEENPALKDDLERIRTF